MNGNTLANTKIENVKGVSLLFVHLVRPVCDAEFRMHKRGAPRAGRTRIISACGVLDNLKMAGSKVIQVSRA
jgi:hypothetical protein